MTTLVQRTPSMQWAPAPLRPDWAPSVSFPWQTTFHGHFSVLSHRQGCHSKPGISGTNIVGAPIRYYRIVSNPYVRTAHFDSEITSSAVGFSAELDLGQRPCTGPRRQSSEKPLRADSTDDDQPHVWRPWPTRPNKEIRRAHCSIPTPWGGVSSRE